MLLPQIEIPQYGFFDSRIKFPKAIVTEPRTVIPYEIELYTEAVMRMDESGCIEIEYYENADDDMMRTLSKIVFYDHAPEIVSMTKEGAMQAFLSFEAGKTHVCTYDTPFMSFKIYVDSKAVDNRLLNEGHLHLNYVLNFADNPPQHFILDIDLKDDSEAY